MKFYNVIDEKGRFNGLKIEIKGDGQYDSHWYSYLQYREIGKEIGDVMGLDKLVQEQSKEKNR